MSEVTNLQRALWAESAINTFRERNGAQADDALADLLCDLMHWATFVNIDFANALDRAEYHYNAEAADESVEHS